MEKKMQNEWMYKMLTIIIVAIIVSVASYFIMEYPIKMYYYGLSNSSIMPPYLLEQFVKNGQVRIKGFCNIDDVDMPLALRLNMTKREFDRFELNGIKVGNLRCEYDIEAGKK